MNKIKEIDSLEYLKTFPDYSLDINFSDPPYGLGSEVIIKSDGKPEYSKAYDFMNKWNMPTGEYWESWFKEAYRTLKYGGYCIMFGMDRQLLMPKYYAGLAGFQEQQSLYWYFISNFPKSADLSKNIDKQYTPEQLNIFSNIRIKFNKFKKEKNISIQEINKYFNFATNGSGMAGHWFANITQQTLPTKKQYFKLKNLLEFDDELDYLFINLEKGNDRPIISKHPNPAGSKGNTFPLEQECNITAPSTPFAQKYDGMKYSISPLKQTNETILVFQKPYKTGSCLHDTLAYENGDEECCCGALDIDNNRVLTDKNDDKRLNGNGSWKTDKAAKNIYEGGYEGNNIKSHNLGRFPSQTFCDSECAKILDKQSGIKISGAMKSTYNVGKSGKDGYLPYHDIYGKYKAQPYPKNVESSSGGCSKILHKCDFEDNEHDIYFYVPKVSSKERNSGCNEIVISKTWSSQEIRESNSFDCFESDGRKITLNHNSHPTLKPISLNTQILKLFKTPNPQKIIFPFVGAGSEIIGGIKAGFNDWVGCELNPEYIEIANARIKYWTNKKIENGKIVSDNKIKNLLDFF